MIWDTFMGGALHTSPERWTAIRDGVESGDIDAVTLMRNFMRLNTECKNAKVMEDAISKCRNPEKIPPFMYYLADKLAPHYRKQLALCVTRSYSATPAFTGRTAVLLDMGRDYAYKFVCHGLSQGEVDASWAALVRSGDKRVFTAANELVEVKWTPDLGGIDRCLISQEPGRCNIVRAANDLWRFGDFERLVIFTDKKAPHFQGNYAGPYDHAMHLYSGVNLKQSFKISSDTEKLYMERPASMVKN